MHTRGHLSNRYYQGCGFHVIQNIKLIILKLLKTFFWSRVRKILSLRLFEDGNGKRWARSVKDENLEILCISQFTLYHRLTKNKPDFHQAMQGPQASVLYNTFLEKLGDNYSADKIKGK